MWPPGSGRGLHSAPASPAAFVTVTFVNTSAVYTPPGGSTRATGACGSRRTAACTASAGTARVMGFVPWERENAYRRRFALVMGQKNQLWWDLPAQESCLLHKEIYRIPPEQFQRRKD